MTALGRLCCAEPIVDLAIQPLPFVHAFGSLTTDGRLFCLCGCVGYSALQPVASSRYFTACMYCLKRAQRQEVIRVTEEHVTVEQGRKKPEKIASIHQILGAICSEACQPSMERLPCVDQITW